MTLTEQWKKGELKDGFYYVKLVNEEDGKTITDKYCSSFRGWEGSENWQISEVLAPVPNYEEWQEEQKSLKVLAEEYCKEKDENQQLKELLKECREKLKYCVRETYELQTKIDEVLK